MEAFHPLIQKWFAEHIGTPTDVQASAWPIIAEDKHVLVTAPTGSGKTLTAFLWALNQLITGKWESGHTHVLYISPLKALNNDIRRNLKQPLESLRAFFLNAGETFPDIRVITRSGDTPPEDRQRMSRHPPEILITTPESLNLLLSSHGGIRLLTQIKTVILDEIHAVAGTKRGVYLMTAVDRLVRLSGEFQRIALSATVRPLETVAAFIGGQTLQITEAGVDYLPRPVSIIRSGIRKHYDVAVCAPEEMLSQPDREDFWEPIVRSLCERIETNTSTLIFANSRRLVERLTLYINQQAGDTLAYAHHGSLSKEIRTEVEQRLKNGELKAIVATTSLELGIDVGAIDEVMLVQAPSTIASAIQRIGRAGHKVGQISRASIYPTHAQDFIEAAVLAHKIGEQDIEAVHLIDNALDVLSQVIISMCGTETWDADELYEFIRTSYPYRNLSRRHFDLVMEMLSGRYSGSRLRELDAKVSLDTEDASVRTKQGALRELYISGGVIPDRGYFQMKHAESGAKIGELDEEFVWERSLGDTFTLGTQHWRIIQVTHSDVRVMPATAAASMAPFWKSESRIRDFHFSSAISEFLEEADAQLEDASFLPWLTQHYPLSETTARIISEFLERQKSATGHALPHRHHIFIEQTHSGPEGGAGQQLVLHNFWGAKINQPYAMCLSAAWRKRYGYAPEIYPSNDCIAILSEDLPGLDELLTLVQPHQIEELLRSELEQGGFFGARFRENCGTAMLINRQRLNQRVPLWMNRLKAKKLLESVSGYEDFPILLETWRTCLQDEFDLPTLKLLMNEIADGTIKVSHGHCVAPSPMSMAHVWRQINDNYMYADDSPKHGSSSKLSDSLIESLIGNKHLRPRISQSTADLFVRKRQRLFQGYAPATVRDLSDWFRERWCMETNDWAELKAAVHRDAPESAEQVLREFESKLHFEDWSGRTFVFTRESRKRWLQAVDQKPEDGNEDSSNSLIEVFAEWLSYQGPCIRETLLEVIPIAPEAIATLLEELSETQAIISGPLIRDCEDIFYCDRKNFETLLRMERAMARPGFEALPFEKLAVFLAKWQGLGVGAGIEDVRESIEQLSGLAVNGALWESEVLPARVANYQSAQLDSIMQEGELRWYGAGEQKVAFIPDADLDLPEHEPATIPMFEGRRTFNELLVLLNAQAQEGSDLLWESVWKGQTVSDSFLAVRRAFWNKFKIPEADRTRRLTRMRAGRGSGTGNRSLPKASAYPGYWEPMSWPDLDGSPIEAEDRSRERVRLLLDRYGILFRELLQRESDVFRWSAVFRSLRMMEFTGEVLSGQFFTGIPGLQFISPAAYRVLGQTLPEDKIFWMNATDPVSLCGLGIDPARGLPSRISGNHVVYRGSRWVVISKRNASELSIMLEPDDPDLQQCFGFIRNLLTREFLPQTRIQIATINAGPACRSPYRSVLAGLFEAVEEGDKLALYRRW